MDVSILMRHRQYINFRISQADKEPWLFTVVYGSPSGSLREEFWRNIKQVAAVISEPCLVTSGFNAIASLSEKKGEVWASFNAYKKFSYWIVDCKLIDLGFMGAHFTWK